MSDTARPPEAAAPGSDEEVADYTARWRRDGRRYVVLGGGLGMGRQTCHALSQLGAEVHVVDSDPDRARRVAGELDGKATAHAADMTRPEEVEALAEAVGDIDGVADVIGLARYETLLETGDDTWAFEEAIVLRHAALAIRSFGRRLAERGRGSMVFVTSVSGMTSAPSHGAYGVYKAGLQSLARTAANELGPSGVRVNTVAPGFVLTPRISAMLDEGGVVRSRDVSPLRRVTMPSDIASAIVFLLGDLASGITGHNLVVDAGATTVFPYHTSSQEV
ncbi:SDR family oxidoreductase [Pseudonocardia xishanensis]|uniref:SDR family oxidoreductase n=1 Tax=Pseudonocardia xishanensis TaxID=630995 RepID=A0ABP8S3X3_9PSEU